MRQSLLNFARSNLGSRLLRTIISRAPSMVPVVKVLENEEIIAFHHPSPAYDTHIVLVPKAAYETLQDLIGKDAELISSVYEAAIEIASLMKLESDGYRIIVNQGKFQEVGLVHFHLVAGDLLSTVS